MSVTSGFICQFCGQLRYTHAGSSLSSYCKECWNAYTRYKYQLKKAGKNCTAKGYRKYRRAQGLPTVEREPVQGRTNKRPTYCSSCKEGRQKTELGLCHVCRNNWSKWALVDPRITPVVFWWVQKTTLGTDVVRGYFGEPYFDGQRVVPPIIQNTLDNMTEEQHNGLKKQFKLETGGTG